ncbi:hypothetical protein TSOC_008935 [Tetrabaena socialis]|uniref:Uncharacterized protein n=1 Tax=Tetrabaena socialis TaxID=47790 RepID=A0A2J7ZX21_9CHLO|nr:hypothetical protein TSOC_008935 [Tetrabaena socialis]|eukprot:PNH04809.1 hypothetical protein TSOC_008935 [Tetrabaena socialis]
MRGPSQEVVARNSLRRLPGHSAGCHAPYIYTRQPSIAAASLGSNTVYESNSGVPALPSMSASMHTASGAWRAPAGAPPRSPDSSVLTPLATWLSPCPNVLSAQSSKLVCEAAGAPAWCPIASAPPPPLPPLPVRLLRFSVRTYCSAVTSAPPVRLAHQQVLRRVEVLVQRAHLDGAQQAGRDVAAPALAAIMPAGPGPDASACSAIRFSLSPSTSCTSGLYVQACCTAADRSKLRSKRHSSGRESEADRPSTLSLKRLVRLLSASRSLESSAEAMCSAAPPRGQRMMGTTPSVTHTEKRPSTTLPTVAWGGAGGGRGREACPATVPRGGEVCGHWRQRLGKCKVDTKCNCSTSFPGTDTVKLRSFKRSSGATMSLVNRSSTKTL